MTFFYYMLFQLIDSCILQAPVCFILSVLSMLCVVCIDRLTTFSANVFVEMYSETYNLDKQTWKCMILLYQNTQVKAQAIFCWIHGILRCTLFPLWNRWYRLQVRVLTSYIATHNGSDSVSHHGNHSFLGNIPISSGRLKSNDGISAIGWKRGMFCEQSVDKGLRQCEKAHMWEGPT